MIVGRVQELFYKFTLHALLSLEGNTVIGKGLHGVLEEVLFERKSLYTVIKSVCHMTDDLVLNAVTEGLRRIRDKFMRSPMILVVSPAIIKEW